jgi:formylglycine-generating enzyme required for sulfatase activity
MASTISGCGLTRGGSGTVGNPYTYSVATDFANRPVNYTSFWDSCRFANWLSNGQPMGAQNANTTERGTYTLDGYNGYDGRTIQRSANAKWAVTSEDEWYKAAYYKGGSTNAGYWDYPISSNSIDPSKANYVYSAGFTTNVGSYSYPSPYGTFDQGGNVWEWTEAIVAPQETYIYRGLRGGAYYDYSPSLLASFRFLYTPPSEDSSFGFRVSEVPEPATILLLVLGTIALQTRQPLMKGRRATDGQAI